MIVHLFSIFDRKTIQFGNPMCLINEGHAVRTFTDLVNDKSEKDNMIAKHADDFDLYFLGTYDGESGLFTVGQPRMVLAGSSARV